MARIDIKQIFGLGEKLRKYRTEANMTQRQMAKSLGMPFSTYSNYENGNRTPDLETLHRICQELGITATELIGTFAAPTGGAFPTRKITLDEADFIVRQQALSDYFSRLNVAGQKKAVDYVKDLAKVDDYLKKSK